MRHVQRREVGHILRSAREFKIKGKLMVGQPCFVCEDSLKLEISSLKVDDLTEKLLDEEFNGADIDQIVYDADLSEEEEGC